MNTFGNLFRLTTFGESHGKALGFVLDGLPPGVVFEEETLRDFLERRRPGGELVSARKETDLPEVLSGFYENKSLGTPVACIFKNKDQKSEDYKDLKPRRGHADKVWLDKYGIQDPRGGGRSSGRETVSRVGGAAFAKMFFNQFYPDVKIKAFTKSIGPIKQKSFDDDFIQSSQNQGLGFIDQLSFKEAEVLLKKAKEDGESYGGEVEVKVFNPPSGLGEPVFKKIKSKMAEAILSVGAVKSFSLGEDVNLSLVKGSEFHAMKASVYGGVQGGITTGDTMTFTAEVKPTSSILDVAKKGRHDPCIVPRALVVIEAMTYLVLIDLVLNNQIYKKPS